MKTNSLIKRLLALTAVLPFALQAQAGTEWPTPDFLLPDDPNDPVPTVHPIFVRPGLDTGNNDGSDWEHAYWDVSLALSGTVDYVADGDYVQLIIAAGEVDDPIILPQTIDVDPAVGGGDAILVAIRGGYERTGRSG